MLQIVLIFEEFFIHLIRIWKPLFRNKRVHSINWKILEYKPTMISIICEKPFKFYSITVKMSVGWKGFCGCLVKANIERFLVEFVWKKLYKCTKKRFLFEFVSTTLYKCTFSFNFHTNKFTNCNISFNFHGEINILAEIFNFWVFLIIFRLNSKLWGQKSFSFNIPSEYSR